MRYADLLAALRHLRRNPRFAVLAVATLALGTAATITAFGLLSAVFMAPLPYANEERLWAPYVTVEAAGEAAGERSRFSYPEFDEFRRSQQVFEHVAGYVGNQLPLTGDAGPDRVATEFVTPEYFTVLGARPQIGRLFATSSGGAAEDTQSLLISDRLWRRRYGADPDIVGRAVPVLHMSFTVVGVLPPDFEGLLDDTELWFSLSVLPTLWDYPDALTSSDFQRVRVVALARPGLSREVIEEGVAHAGRDFQALSGAARSTGAETLAESRRDLKLRRILVLLFAAACAVLLIASANVAGLQLARTASRKREIAIRNALGATRWRVVSQTLIESGILAGTGAVVGLALAYLLLRVLVIAAPPDLPAWGLFGADLKNMAQAGISPAVLFFTLSVALVAMLLAGLVPALEASRRGGAVALRQGAGSLAGAQGHGPQLGRRILVITQTAAAVVLLAAAGLLLRSLNELLEIDPGFEAGSVLALRIESAALYDRERAPVFHRRLIEEVTQVPGVSGAALGSCMPLSCRRTTVLGSVDGRTLPEGTSPAFGTQFVSPGFFRTLGIPLLAGRDFTENDRMSSPRVVVVSESLARRVWPNESPIGRRLNSVTDFPENEEAEVIGVMGDVRLQSLTDPPAGDLYVSDYQNGAAWGILFVEMTGNRAAIEPALRTAFQRVDPDLPFQAQGSVDEHLARATSRNRFATALISAIAVVALFLTLVALYGLVEQAVDARRRELALRVALGASRSNLFRLVLRQGLLPVVAGLVLGVPLAWASSRWLQALLYGAEGVAPAVYLFVVVLIVAAAALACFVPAKRALGIDPAMSLRFE
jgi:putative ABC transport system permease protein